MSFLTWVSLTQLVEGQIEQKGWSSHKWEFLLPKSCPSSPSPSAWWTTILSCLPFKLKFKFPLNLYYGFPWVWTLLGYRFWDSAISVTEWTYTYFFIYLCIYQYPWGGGGEREGKKEGKEEREEGREKENDDSCYISGETVLIHSFISRVILEK